MTNLRKANDEQLEAQRFTASQASRESTTLDVLSVYWVCKALLEQGEVEAAKARWLKFKTTGE